MYQYSNQDITGSLNSPESNQSCNKQDNLDCKHISDITLKEFFDFLSCACKSALDLEEKHCKELLNNEFVTKLLEISVDKLKLNVELDGSSISLDRDRLQESSIFGPSNEEDRQTQQGIRSLLIRINRKYDDQYISFSHLPILEAENILKQKVDEIINEGLLDSIFPFLISKFSISMNSRNVDSYTSVGESQKLNKHSIRQRSRKSQDPEAEIEIQVCDEVNSVSKNFKCSQSLLLSKMEYFAEVTEGQRLEDMDISVHCDVTIFEWLMKWVHGPTKGTNPALSVNNVTPILISAMFLRMEPLVDESVNFFKNNITEIIQTTASFSCFSDSILEKIADTMTNIELDCLEDPQDKIKSKLFTKFIMSLGKRQVDKRKGHHSTLSSLYRCLFCRQILDEELGQSVPCIPDLIAVDSIGNVRGRHKDDTNWNLNSYIKQLKRELSTWQDVYWKLWGTCHYLECIKCKEYYPIVSSMCCRYHPNGAHFDVRHNSKSNLLMPVGHYVCCRAGTFRFDVLSLPSGCLFKSHAPLESEENTMLISVMENKRNAICYNPQEVMYGQERHGDKDLDGNMIVCSPSWRPLIQGNYQDKVYTFNDILNTLDEKESDGDVDYDGNCTRSTMDEIDNESSESDFNDIASVGDGEDSDGSYSSKKCFSQSKSQINTKLWTTHRSIRFNQDNQREREEKIIKSIINKLNRSKNESEFDIFLDNNDYNSCQTSAGGVYAMLEDEWREESVHSEISNNTCFTPSRSPKPRNTKFTYF